jgi:hypothetical protein
MPLLLIGTLLLLAVLLALAALLLSGRGRAGSHPQGLSPAEAAREAEAHLRKAIGHFERKDHPDWMHLANLSLIEALKLGHNDGEAAERLAINLEKCGKPGHAMEVCSLVLDPGYRMKKGAALTKKDFEGRLARYREKYGSPAQDVPLFTREEAVAILRASRYG